MAIIASIAIASGALASAKTSDAKVNYLKTQMRAEQSERKQLEVQKMQTEQRKSELENEAKQKDQKIKELNDQLQAKLEQKRLQQQQQLSVQIANAVVPSAHAASSGDIPSIIAKWANINGISAEWAIGIARCESGFNIYAHNPSGATGLFQFMPSTFYGNGGTDIYSAEDQSRVATYMLAHGQAHQWVCKG